MGDWDGEDRRRFKRLASEELVSFSLFGGSSGLGQGGNISRAGMRFTAVGCAFRTGELVRVSFNISQQTVDAVGRVIWVRQHDEITAEVGLEFVRIDPWAARLLDEEERRRTDAEGEQP